MKFEKSSELTGLHILTVGTNAPPNIRGGLDSSMVSIAKGLNSAGAKVTILAAAEDKFQDADYEFENFPVRRRWFPRSYPARLYAQSPIKKMQFQIADHVALRNIEIFRAVIDDVRPDIVTIHSLVGIGHNVLKVAAELSKPVAFYMHELGLACINRAMYRNSKNCDGQCAPCRVSTGYQQSLHHRLSSIEYISPSQANMDRVARFFDFKNARQNVIINPNFYPVNPNRVSSLRQDGRVVLCYVGRIDREKGVDFLLDLIAQSNLKDRIFLRVIGDGVLLNELKEKYVSESWLNFEGWATQEYIANALAVCEALLIPSLWPETLGGVIVHAFLAGLPVIGSDTGGIPELVNSDINGLLAPPGDRERWFEEIDRFLSDKDLRKRLADGARQCSYKYDAREIIKEHIAVISRLAGRA